MPKVLPFELFECGYDNLCNLRPGSVFEELAISIRSLQSNKVIQAVNLANANFGILLEHVHKAKHFMIRF